VTSLRELADGTLIVVDGRERALFALSCDGAAERFGREDAGPEGRVLGTLAMPQLRDSSGVTCFPTVDGDGLIRLTRHRAR
jgi:hypothetical protein